MCLPLMHIGRTLGRGAVNGNPRELLDEMKFRVAEPCLECFNIKHMRYPFMTASGHVVIFRDPAGQHPNDMCVNFFECPRRWIIKVLKPNE